MKRILVASVMLFGIFQMAIGQGRSPDITFIDTPYNHNMHIASDGNYLYSVNGGDVEHGRITRFTLDGDWDAQYDIELDMRSIMYNSKDKHFYVNSFDQNIYRINNLAYGTFDIMLEEFCDNSQATPALGPKGEKLYLLDDGTIYVYDFPSGNLTATFNGIDHGEELSTGSVAIAVDKKNMYTWDAEKQIVYVYNRKKGNQVKQIKISKGDYGFSLSVAKNWLFVAEDGDYEDGIWYGYDLKTILK